MDPIRITSRFAYGPLKNPPRKISYKYNSMLTYIPVSFFISLKRVRVRVKNMVRVRVSFRVRLGFGFGIGNLIGGAAGTVDPCGRKTLV